MKSFFGKAAFGALFAADLATSREVILDSSCIRLMPEASSFKLHERSIVMNDGSRTLDYGDFITTSDLGEIGRMPLVEREFTRPYSLKICSNEERIFGMQLTTMMYRADFKNEAEIMEKYGNVETIEWLDELIEESVPHEMKFIGDNGQGQPEAKCYMLRLFEDGDWTQIEEVSVWTDSSGVRSLSIVTSKDDENADDRLKVHAYGYQPGVGDKTTFEFWLGKQMFGIYGVEEESIFYDDAGLLALSFYRDDCART